MSKERFTASLFLIFMVLIWIVGIRIPAIHAVMSLFLIAILGPFPLSIVLMNENEGGARQQLHKIIDADIDLE
jgi:hypothetical protein